MIWHRHEPIHRPHERLAQGPSVPTLLGSAQPPGGANRFPGGVNAEMLGTGMASEDGGRSGSSSPLETSSSAGLTAAALGGGLGSGAHPNVFVR